MKKKILQEHLRTGVSANPLTFPMKGKESNGVISILNC